MHLGGTVTEFINGLHFVKKGFGPKRLEGWSCHVHRLRRWLRSWFVVGVSKTPPQGLVLALDCPFPVFGGGAKGGILIVWALPFRKKLFSWLTPECASYAPIWARAATTQDPR